MAWSYKNPLNSTKDQVRFLIRDTDQCDQLVQDEEITWLLQVEPNIYRAAAEAARSIAAQFARTADERVGDIAISLSQRSKAMLDIAKQLEMKSAISGGGVGFYAGGISVSDKLTQTEDDDRVAPAFSKDKHNTETHFVEDIDDPQNTLE